MLLLIEQLLRPDELFICNFRLMVIDHSYRLDYHDIIFNREVVVTFMLENPIRS